MGQLIHPRRVFRAFLNRVVDGDTVDVLELPPTRLRLLGFDAAEINRGTEEEKTVGWTHAGWISDWLIAHPDFVVDDRGPDPFGRRLVWIYDRITLECLNFEFVKKFPDRARNPRLMAAEIFDIPPEQAMSYRPERIAA